MSRAGRRRSLGVAAGAFAATVLPIVVLPVAGMLVLVRLRRDVAIAPLAWLLVAALVWSLPLLITAGPGRFGVSLVEAASVVLIAMAGHALGRRAPRVVGPWLVGCIAGLTVLLVVTVLQGSGLLYGWMSASSDAWGAPRAWVEAVNPLRWPSRAWGWSTHPNVWAASAATVSFGAFVWTSRTAWAWLAVVPTFAILVLTGSRTALLATILSVLVLGASHVLGRRPTRAATVSRWLGAAALIVVIGVLAIVGRDGRVGLALPFGTQSDVAIGDARTNLIRSSERLDDRVVWKPHDVTVTPAEDQGDATPAERWSIQKEVGVGGSARLVQRVTVQAGDEHVLSLWLAADASAAQPSVVLSSLAAGGSLSLDRRGDRWTSDARGDLEILDASVRDDSENGWSVTLRFRAAGSGPTDVLVALVPDRNPRLDTTIRVHSPHLRPAAASDAYLATFPRDRLRTAAAGSVDARIEIFEGAWTAFLQRPLWGWGRDHLADVVGRTVTTVDGGGPAHAHNAVLQASWQRGIVGLLGLGLLFGPLLACGRHVARPAFAVLVIGLTTFDYTLWAGGVAYAVAALGGFLMTDTMPDVSAEQRH